MPTYQYACTACGHQLEAVQSFTDEPLSQCPACEGRLRKLFSSVGVVFKGSGFYRTDSRNGDKANGNKEAAKSAEAGSGSGSGSTESKGSPGSKGSAESKGSSSPSTSTSGSTSAAPAKPAA